MSWGWSKSLLFLRRAPTGQRLDVCGFCPTANIWISSVSWMGSSWHVVETYVMKKYCCERHVCLRFWRVLFTPVNKDDADCRMPLNLQSAHILFSECAHQTAYQKWANTLKVQIQNNMFQLFIFKDEQLFIVFNSKQIKFPGLSVHTVLGVVL